jgi:hypothetical protein
MPDYKGGGGSDASNRLPIVQIQAALVHVDHSRAAFARTSAVAFQLRTIASPTCSANALTLAECRRSSGLTTWIGMGIVSQSGNIRCTSPLASSSSNSQVGEYPRSAPSASVISLHATTRVPVDFPAAPPLPA